MFEKNRSISHLLKKPRLRIPKICVLCQQYHHDQYAICQSCYNLLTPLGASCRYCALPVSPGSTLICGQCCLLKPTIDRIITAYHYEEPLRTLLHTFKYYQGLYLTSLLAHLMLQASFDVTKTDCLMPIPLHRKRLRQRGFNQSAVLAKRLAQELCLPYLPTSCKKIINTAPQAGLDGYQRRVNLINAFMAKPIPYQRVTLIDDLYTTGSTANEMARTLKAQGVREVQVWCCARAGRSNKLVLS